MKRKILLISFLTVSLGAYAQTDYAYKTFDDTRVVNGHSVETNVEGIMTFIISHRFGALNSGFYNAWGLDAASMRMGLDYGITNNLSIGIGRSTYEKTIDGFLKFKLLSQSSGDRVFPFSVTLLGTSAYKALRKRDGIVLRTLHRFSYTGQLLIARKFGSRVSLQVMPTFLHRNLVQDIEENDIFSLGMAGQFHFLKNWSISLEYYATPSSYLPEGENPETGEEYYQSLAIGIQIDTKGHVFQLQFGNSRGMIEKFFIAETFDSWLDGGIHFGFNITRDFKVKGRKIR